jgi:hypothetical protein
LLDAAASELGGSVASELLDTAVDELEGLLEAMVDIAAA